MSVSLKQYVCVVLWTVIATFSMYAQTFTLKGKVTDATTSEALYGVTVHVDQAKGVSTDINGNYSLELNKVRVK